MNISEGAPLVYVSFSAEINPNTTEALIATIANLANLKVKEVYLLFSTPGGQVMSGMNLYSVLRGMPIKLSTMWEMLIPLGMLYFWLEITVMLHLIQLLCFMA